MQEIQDFRTFLVPCDFSEHARQALLTATALARRLDGDVHLVHVIQPPTYSYGMYPEAVAGVPPIDMGTLRTRATEALAHVVSDHRDGLSGKLEPHLVEGPAISDAVCEVASELGADLIVMGTHGRTGIAHVFLGSVAERTLRGAPCPVLTVKAAEECTA